MFARKFKLAIPFIMGVHFVLIFRRSEPRQIAEVVAATLQHHRSLQLFWEGLRCDRGLYFVCLP